MDIIQELRKYKKLLDSGAITEDEFRQTKQKLLGLEPDEENKVEEEQQETIEQAKLEVEQREREIKTAQQEVEKKAQKSSDEEKTKEKVRFETTREVEEANHVKKKEESQKTLKPMSSVIGAIVLWVIAAGCLVVALGALSAGDVIPGIVCLLWAIMACPLITSETKNIVALNGYYRYKKVIVIVLVVVFFASIIVRH